ncbi:hypothetical protein INS49_013286 [Diaporthe citri]|uniref:uncharacterized protein n=1 Tax=Diaporthe citri TaxID=83186 RepID=UPI001C7E769B|nr:uncharacterized protein INS49_013286 [Diaporthe citri]KAG6357409.1 hypothetical protein INS49_013286 [Diaporthe citri]
MPSVSTSSTSHQRPREMKRLITSLRKAPTPLSSPLPPSPPPTPCPWLWRCHSCYTIYRLAVTRRCLDCDHTFCLGEPASPPKGKKRKRGGPCKAEFDYTGWKARGSWRRTVLLNGDAAGTATGLVAKKNEQNWGNEHRAATEAIGDEARFEDKRERLFLRRRHSCFVHCDFPSECHHSLFRAQQEGRPILREAEALDAAEAAALEEAEAEEREREGKRWTRRLTVQEYKQRRAERRRKSKSAAVVCMSDADLSTVTEEDDDDDNDNDNVSPCSPTSPDPPGDLMRDVSPVEYDEDNEQPLSPSGRRRASLLATTDTPVDFATTAAPLSFDDTYSDDEEEYGGCDEPGAHNEDQRHRAKSRRKIAQLTGEGLESFGPFILDTSAPSPTSPPAAAATTTMHVDRSGNNPTALDLQAAWSEQAWFSSSSTREPLSPKSPERVGKRDRMLALLGRRGSGGDASSPRQPAQEIHQPRQQHHADATAVAGEEWESWSDSSSSSSSSASSGASLLLSSGTEGHRGVMPGPTIVDDDDTDDDGDVPMRDATAQSPPPTKDVDDEDMAPPMTRTGGHGVGARGDEARDLRALLRMRNAFMRGEMI